MDPEPEMLAEAARQAQAASISNVKWAHGNSADLPGEFGRFKLVTMGRSFHWMDREQVLTALGGMVDDNGGLVIAHNSCLVLRPTMAWQQAIADIQHRFLPPDQQPGTTAVSDVHRPHEEILTRSPFRHVQQLVYECGRPEHRLGRAADRSGRGPAEGHQRHRRATAAARHGGPAAAPGRRSATAARCPGPSALGAALPDPADRPRTGRHPRPRLRRRRHRRRRRLTLSRPPSRARRPRQTLARHPRRTPRRPTPYRHTESTRNLKPLSSSSHERRRYSPAKPSVDCHRVGFGAVFVLLIRG